MNDYPAGTHTAEARSASQALKAYLDDPAGVARRPEGRGVAVTPSMHEVGHRAGADPIGSRRDAGVGPRTLTVGQLRELIADLPDEMPVCINVHGWFEVASAGRYDASECGMYDIHACNVEHMTNLSGGGRQWLRIEGDI